MDDLAYSHISRFYCARDGYQQTTFRKNGGKAHRGLIRPDGTLQASCTCPGSARGTLTKGAQIIAEGWEQSNCGN